MKNFVNNDSKKTSNVTITPDLYNEYKEYHSNVLFSDKKIDNIIPVVSSESINYVIINYYYKYFHQVYPIIDYNYFAIHAKNGTLTEPLLYAMYGMAYFMKPDTEISKVLEYIDKAKSLISEYKTTINVQLLQAINLVSIYGKLLRY